MAQPQLLDARGLNRIMSTMATELEANQQLAWLNRTEVNNAVDEELTAKFEGTVFAADLVSDDARGVTYESGKLTVQPDNVPNLKIGARLNQADLNFLRRMQARQAGTQDQGIFTDWKNRRINALLRGIQLRQEALIVAAKLDSFVYDRLGLKIAGSFGTPAELKSTVATLWTNPAATPITDLQQKKAFAEDTYGRSYNRVTMSTTDFQRAAATTEFQSKASLRFRFTVPNGAISPYSPEAVDLFEAISGMKLDIYNVRYKTKNPAGAISQQRTLPIGKVLLTNSDDDNNEGVFDLANGIVTESIVAEMVNSFVEGLDGEQFGPASYIAPTSPDLNPPGIAMWGVARCFPRKHDETECAVLTVG